MLNTFTGGWVFFWVVSLIPVSVWWRSPTGLWFIPFFFSFFSLSQVLYVSSKPSHFRKYSVLPFTILFSHQNKYINIPVIKTNEEMCNFKAPYLLLRTFSTTNSFSGVFSGVFSGIFSRVFSVFDCSRCFLFFLLFPRPISLQVSWTISENWFLQKIIQKIYIYYSFLSNQW